MLTFIVTGRDVLQCVDSVGVAGLFERPARAGSLSDPAASNLRHLRLLRPTYRRL